jgi:hypothetical protein
MHVSKRGCLVSLLLALLTGAYLYLSLGHYAARWLLLGIGFDPIGRPDEVWEEYIVDPTAYVEYRQPPTVIVDRLPTPSPSTPEAGLTPTGLSYTDWFLTSTTVSDVTVYSMTSNGPITMTSADAQREGFAEAFLIGESIEGSPLAVAEYREDALGSLCDFWMSGCKTNRYRIERLDFRPGGMIVYGDINIEGVYWYENVGVALQLNADRISFEPVGIVWDDELFALPESGPFADRIAELAALGNRSLAALRMEIGGTPVRLAELRLTDEQFLLILY